MAVLAAREAGVEVIGDIELFCRERRRHAPDAPVVAITGTNGKSTTTALIAHLMRVAGFDTQMGGNIGTRSCRWSRRASAAVYVIEMSSYQIDLAPASIRSVGILLNVSEDHIDRHGSLSNYAAVKERLVAGVRRTARRSSASMMTGAATPPTGSSRRPARRPVSVQNAAPTASMSSVDIWRAAGGARGEIARIGGIGPCAACTMRRMWRVGLCARARGRYRRPAHGLRRFPGLAHRMEQVGHLGNVLFVNDSKATNADATARALAVFPDIFWIAGGKPKDGGITGLASYFPRIRKAYLIGEARRSSRAR